MDILAELQKLHELHRAGALSDEEFARAKATILGDKPKAIDSAEADAGTETHIIPDFKQDLIGPCQNKRIENRTLKEPEPATPAANKRGALRRKAGNHWQPYLAAVLFILLLCATFAVVRVVITEAGIGSGPTTRRYDPAEVERIATGQLKERLETFVDTQFPTEVVIVDLTNGRYGKHKFSIVNSKWNMEPNRESLAYPFAAARSILSSRSGQER